MDKLIAAVAAVSAALYFLSGGIAWYRVLSPTYHRPALKFVLDRAIAWTALGVIFSRFVLVRTGMIDWSDDRFDVVLIVALIAIWSSGLASIRAFTVLRFGAQIWLLLAFISLAAGTAVAIFS